MRILVTGASSRIGQAILRLLASRGHYVIAAYRSRRRRVEEALGGSGEPVALDLRDEGSIESLASGVGELDALVNNAGVLGPGWEAIGVNLIGTIRLTEALIPRLREGSCIVFVGDALAQEGMSKHPLYAASKAGIRAYALSLAKRLAPRIRVNVLEPGIVRTDLLESRPALEGEFSRAIPMRRVADPGEVAESVAFLLENGYLNGAVLRVDGGLGITNALGI